MNELNSMLKRMASEFPDRPAVQFRDQRLSYGRLAETMEALARKMGPVASRRFLLLLPDGMPGYLCHLHLFLAGAINVPVSVQSTTPKIRELCERVRPHFIVTNSALRARHKSALEAFPCLIVKPDAKDVPWGFDYEVSNPAAAPAPVNRPVEVDGSGIRMIVFTSGSTGAPKGVCLSESNLLSAAGMMVSFLALDPSRRSVVTVPLYDYYGFIQIYGHILGQCGYIFGDSIGMPHQLLKRIHEEKATDLVLVPHTLREMLRLTGTDHVDVIRQLRFMTSSSDILTRDLLEQAFAINPDLKVINIYGLTEAGRACYKVFDRTSIQTNSIGIPSPGVEIVLDGMEGDTGEIILRGPNVMLGYLRDIHDDRVVFSPCTEMRTGDLARCDERGELILLGRRDHMINIRGSKIHPVEIETIALQAPDVVDACARVSGDGDGEPSIHLDVVLREGAGDLGPVSAHMRRNLQPLFFPQKINAVPGITRTELGSKIIRAKGRP
ncbi:MAG: Long-chain-fatty-acid--CoA ligase [Syntrophus sp. PtaB.Bin138]|nr:MAG: Long-chain-fatty-acid--CoA ligase [Syntrophus sp. PtaB.Bin138]